MNAEKHRRIEQRAYAFWQAEGGPEGKHEEHWHRALQEIEAEETPSVAGKRKPHRQSRQIAADAGNHSRPQRKKAKA